MGERRMVITREMTVREAMARYPQVRTVLERHGLGECGGHGGSPEPLSFFARAHQVDAEQLLREMNEAVGEQAAEAPVTHAEPASAPPMEIYRVFIKTALVVALTSGWTVGAISLALLTWGGGVPINWVGLFQAHGFAQVFGWIGLFIMGIAYHVLPRLKATQLYSRRLAMTSYWLVLGALVARSLGQPLLTGVAGGGALVISGALLLAGATVFAYVMTRTFASSPQPSAFFERYILGGVVWFWVTALIGGAGAVVAAQSGLTFLPGSWDSAFLHAGLAGFITLLILGITLRTVPAFLGLRALNQKAFGPIFWMINAGVALTVALDLVTAVFSAEMPRALLALGPVLECVGAWAYVYCLNLFRKPGVDSTEGGLDRAYEPFIKVAYLWLLFASAIWAIVPVVRALDGGDSLGFLLGGYRHALTIGFISLMTMGMASRMIAVFAGVRLHSARLLYATLVLVNLGVLTRVVIQFLPGAPGAASDAFLGMSGVVALVGLVLFVYNIWRTIETRQPQEEVAVETPQASQVISGDMKVSSMLGEFPQALGVFLDHGLGRLRDPQERQRLGSELTIQGLAEAEGLDLTTLLADLNRVFGIVRGNGNGAAQPAGAIEGDTIVGNLLEERPELLEVFVKHGFAQLRDVQLRTTMAKTVTIAMAAQIHGVSLGDLLAELNGEQVKRVTA